MSTQAAAPAGRRQFVDNVAARGLAMAAVAVGTLIVARADGAAAVGVLAMLRVLPGLVGVVLSGGLPGALPYFLAGPDREDPRLPSSVMAIAVAGGVAGTVGWALAAPALTPLFFRGQSTLVVACAGLTVLTQLLATTTKACNQGSGDLGGANLVIVLEEALFLPAYGLLVLAGTGAAWRVVWALVIADVGSALVGWVRLQRRRFAQRWSTPSAELTRRICGYGARGQLGGLLNLVNLRLDFAVLGAVAGPSTLGIYAVASKCAEVVRVAPLALTYVLYPAMRRAGPDEAARRARQMLPRAGWSTAVAVVPVCIGAIFLLPLVYGSEFQPAVVPACILLVGLSADGLGAVASAFLYGSGHPGLNSIGVGAGVAVTVVLDAILIPPFGANGAASASSLAYLVTNVVLLAFFFQRANRPHSSGSAPTSLEHVRRRNQARVRQGLVALPNGWHVSREGTLVDVRGVQPCVVMSADVGLRSLGA
jgi:O-antigen/teichoic acid export membrane protein